MLFFLLLPINLKKDKIPHKKIAKKTKKRKKERKCPSSSSPLLRPPTACTSATSRGRPPSRSYKRCSRTRRASRSQPCVVFVVFFSFVVVLSFFFDDKKRALVSAMNESARWRSNRDSILCDADSFGVSLASNIGAGLKRSATPSRRTQTRGARRDDDDGKSTSEEKEASRRVDHAWWGKRKRGLCEHYATPSSSRKRDRESPFFSGSFLTFSKGSRKNKKQKGEKAALF